MKYLNTFVFFILGISSLEATSNEVHFSNLEVTKKLIWKNISSENLENLNGLVSVLDSLNEIETNSYYLTLSSYTKGIISEIHLNQVHACANFLSALRESKQSLTEERNIHIHISSLYKTITILINLGKFEEARSLIQYGINVLESTDLNYPKWKMYHSLGFLIYSQKNEKQFSVGIKELLKSSKFGKSYKDRYYLNSQNLIGLIQIESNQLDSALKTFNNILDFETSKSNLEFKRLAYHNLAYLQSKQGNYSNAIKLLNKSSLFIDTNNADQLFYLTNLDLCEAYLNLDSLEQAIHFGESAISIYDKVDLLPKHYKIYTHLAQAHYKAGNYEKSYYYQNRYFEENMKYMDRVRELNIDLDEYKIQEQVAGFLSGNMIPDEENGFTLNFFVAWITSIFMALFIGGLIKQKLIKRSLQNSLTEILK